MGSTSAEELPGQYSPAKQPPAACQLGGMKPSFKGRYFSSTVYAFSLLYIAISSRLLSDRVAISSSDFLLMRWAPSIFSIASHQQQERFSSALKDVVQNH
jgi:hypothetical protein